MEVASETDGAVVVWIRFESRMLMLYDASDCEEMRYEAQICRSPGVAPNELRHIARVGCAVLAIIIQLLEDLSTV